MIGVILRLLSDFVEKNWGTQSLNECLKAAGFPDDFVFRLDTAYPDEQWQSMFRAATDVAGLSPDDLELTFAHYCGKDMSVRFPGFLQGVTSARDIIERQPSIHNFMAASLKSPSARKAVAEKFRLEGRPDETVMHYVSPNKMCILYRGLAEWAAEYFNEKVEIKEPHCLKRGDAECEIHVQYLDHQSTDSQAR
jgi:predicted hydrocarbon binding protein